MIPNESLECRSDFAHSDEEFQSHALSKRKQINLGFKILRIRVQKSKGESSLYQLGISNTPYTSTEIQGESSLTLNKLVAHKRSIFMSSIELNTFNGIDEEGGCVENDIGWLVMVFFQKSFPFNYRSLSCRALRPGSIVENDTGTKETSGAVERKFSMPLKSARGRKIGSMLSRGSIVEEWQSSDRKDCFLHLSVLIGKGRAANICSKGFQFV
eukprot:scaffold6796_cov103-Cylindrotheca_fusiformis.AAC.3